MMNQKGGSSDEESRRCIGESKRILVMDQEDGSIGGELIGKEH